MTNLDVIIIGAGFSGLYQLHKCRDELNLNTLVVEEGSDLGGTWYWNTYPGARCDSESQTYGYTFSENIYKNWTWNEKYPKQVTILKYLKYVEKKLSLRKDILFNNKIISAKYLEGKNLWKLKTNKNKILNCKYLICAVGSLSAANIPEIKGLNSYEGKYYHTGRWPKNKVSFLFNDPTVQYDNDRKHAGCCPTLYFYGYINGISRSYGKTIFSYTINAI